MTKREKREGFLSVIPVETGIQSRDSDEPARVRNPHGMCQKDPEDRAVRPDDGQELLK